MTQMSQVRDDRIREWLAQTEGVRTAARDVAGGLTREQFNWRPDPSRWSVGQCIHHITLTARLYPEEIERMIAEARTRASQRAYRESFLARMVVQTMDPPPKMRVRTKKMVVPAMDLEPQQVLAEFDQIHARLEELMVKADGVSLQHGRMRSPFLPLIRFTLGQVFAVNIAHARRHLWQAREVRQHPQFPRA
jgi:hypothetical protein